MFSLLLNTLTNFRKSFLCEPKITLVRFPAVFFETVQDVYHIVDFR